MGNASLNELAGLKLDLAPATDARLCVWIAQHRSGNGFAGDIANLPALLQIYRNSHTGRIFVGMHEGEIESVALCRLVEKVDHARHLWFGAGAGRYLAVDEMIALTVDARRRFVRSAREAYPHLRQWIFLRGNRSVLIGPRHIRLLERI